jgi:hypothetical protein
MPITFAPNPTRSLSLTANPQASFSATTAIDWSNVLNAPAIIDNLDDLTTTGILVQTDASGAVATRTLTAPAAGITVSNGDGVAGNPTLALANDLAALEGLGSTGIAVRTAADTWAQRTIAGTANEITATNGDGVAGNPTLSLPAALTFTGKTVTGGTYVGPTIDASIMFTDGGSNRVGLDLGSQNVMAYSGQGNSKTIAIHLNPGSGTLPIDTIAEFVVQRTADQAFGGNYGRWSFTALGSDYGDASGIYGEYGGTVTPGPFIFNLGIENPASTFASYEYFRLHTQAAGSAVAIGAVGFGASDTVSQNKIILHMSNPDVAGTRDSHTLLWEGKSYDTGPHSARWRAGVDVTSNAAASSFFIEQALDAGAYTRHFALTDAGALSLASLSLTTSLTAPIVYGGSAAGSSLILRSTSNGSPSGDFVAFYTAGAEQLRIPSSGGLLSGAIAAPVTGGFTARHFFTGTGSAASVSVLRQTTPGASGAIHGLGSSRGTPASPAALQTNDGLGAFIWYGDDGADLNNQGATITGVADGNWSTTSFPTRISMNTVPSGSTTSVEALRIGSAQTIYFPGVGTTASAANAFLDSGSTPANQLLRSTSSLRYKRDVEAVPLQEALAIIKSLEPIKYRSRAQADDPRRQFFGLGAEDVAEADDRLVNFYQDMPDGVQYDRVGVLLIPIVQELARRAGLN